MLNQKIDNLYQNGLSHIVSHCQTELKQYLFALYVFPMQHLDSFATAFLARSEPTQKHILVTFFNGQLYLASCRISCAGFTTERFSSAHAWTLNTFPCNAFDTKNLAWQFLQLRFYPFPFSSFFFQRNRTAAWVHPAQQFFAQSVAEVIFEQQSLLGRI